MYVWVLIFVLLLVVVIAVILILASEGHLGDAYYWINSWNKRITSIQESQNKNTDPGLPPSMQYAEECHHRAARRLNRLISAKHDEIKAEVWSLINRGYYGMPMVELDHAQKAFFRGQQGWRPIWVKFIDTWAGTARELPTLHRIVEKMGDDVLLLHVSVMWPPTMLRPHRGVSKGVYRYHYGLDIPSGDTGLMVENVGYRWREGEGVIWDDTLLHAAWNRTDQPRMVIFADLPREMGTFNNFVNRRVHSLIQHTKHIKEIQEKLEAEGLHTD